MYVWRSVLPYGHILMRCFPAILPVQMRHEKHWRNLQKHETRRDQGRGAAILSESADRHSDPIHLYAHYAPYDGAGGVRYLRDRTIGHGLYRPAEFRHRRFHYPISFQVSSGRRFGR